MLLLDNQIKQVVDAARASITTARFMPSTKPAGARLQPRDQDSYRLPRVMEAQNNGAPADAAVASGSPGADAAKRYAGRPADGY